MTKNERNRTAALYALLRAAEDLTAYISAPLAPGEDPNWADKSVVLPDLREEVRAAAHKFVEADTAAIIAESTYVEAPEANQ